MVHHTRWVRQIRRMMPRMYAVTCVDIGGDVVAGLRGSAYMPGAPLVSASLVCEGVLVYEEGGEAQAVRVGEAGWYAWLAGARAFAYRGPGGTYAARWEAGGYWKAYGKRGGRMRRVYLGKGETLTQARLEAAVARLAALDV